MKNVDKVDYYSRQNHKKAITYLKSSLYCYRREKQLMYLVIVCSIIFCVLGIVFSMLPKLLSITDKKFIDMCEGAVNALGIASGLFLVVQLFIKIITNRLHLEAINSIERFDNYVYDICPNRMIMRPMTEAQLENNASKIQADDANFTNTYFPYEADNDPLVIYNNQHEIFVNEFHLMQYVKSKFFNILWISFFIIILAFAIAVDEGFLITLLKIFFPSISVISLIVSSMLGYNQSMRFLQNTLTQFETAEKDPSFDKRSTLTLRQNQDSIFQYRLNSFTVPMFLVRRYEKSAQKQLRNTLTNESVPIPKTSPFIAADYASKYTRPSRREQSLKEVPPEVKPETKVTDRASRTTKTPTPPSAQPATKTPAPSSAQPATKTPQPKSQSTSRTQTATKSTTTKTKSPTDKDKAKK